MQIELIKKISNDLILSLDYSKGGKGLCFSVCFPLSFLLRCISVENKLVHQKVKNNNLDHFYILIEEKYILDPTHLQFLEPNSKTLNPERIYFDSGSELDYIKYLVNHKIIDIETRKDIFNGWNQLSYQRNENTRLNAINNVIICFNFWNILTDLFGEDEQNYLKSNSLYFYLNSIYKTIEKWSNDEEFILKTENKCFKILGNIKRIKHV